MHLVLALEQEMDVLDGKMVGLKVGLSAVWMGVMVVPMLQIRCSFYSFIVKIQYA